MVHISTIFIFAIFLDRIFCTITIFRINLKQYLMIMTYTVSALTVLIDQLTLRKVTTFLKNKKKIVNKICFWIISL